MSAAFEGLLMMELKRVLASWRLGDLNRVGLDCGGSCWGFRDFPGKCGAFFLGK